MIRVVITAIGVVVGTYVALAYAQNIQTEAGGFTRNFAPVAKAFRGE